MVSHNKMLIEDSSTRLSISVGEIDMVICGDWENGEPIYKLKLIYEDDQNEITFSSSKGNLINALERAIIKIKQLQNGRGD